MLANIIVVDNIKQNCLDIVDTQIVSAKDYLTNEKYFELVGTKIYNLSRSFKYQSNGYYVSLLAQARGHKVFPSITTIQELRSQSVIKSYSEELDSIIQKSLKNIKSDKFVLSIYFGENIARQHSFLSKKIFDFFCAPLLRANFSYKKKWHLISVSFIAIDELPEQHIPYFKAAAEEYFSKKRFRQPKRHKSFYDLAILLNPKEVLPPSNKKAIKKFIGAAEEVGFRVEVIGKDDFSHLSEFDALFIRETTAVNHHTYRFAQRAQAEGLVVIDDPESILKCTNKVYLAELLSRSKIPHPKTLVICKNNWKHIEARLGFPSVLKQPDSSFSQGVVKIADKQSLPPLLEKFFETSELIVAQEFIPTDFDWRIGLLDKQPLFACKYFMANGHWQVYNWHNKKEKYGNFETYDIAEVPPQIIKVAIKAANYIGNGLYGVDIKVVNDKACLIEINDNPNVDAGIEDLILKDRLYLTIMQSLLTRVRIKKRASCA